MGGQGGCSLARLWNVSLVDYEEAKAQGRQTRRDNQRQEKGSDPGGSEWKWASLDRHTSLIITIVTVFSILVFYSALVDPGPDLIVCDEGHRIKNLKTDVANALSSVRTKSFVSYPINSWLLLGDVLSWRDIPCRTIYWNITRWLISFVRPI